MPDLVYTPGVRVIIDSSVAGKFIDVSDDIEDISVELRENNMHQVRVTLSNARAKYDGVFAPNDRFSVQLKRIKWLQIFSGYTTSVPYFAAYQGSVTITADCTLKSLKYFPWDARSQKAQQFINMRNHTSGSDREDGGMANAIKNLLTEVARWPAEKVHIGGIPTNWTNKLKTVYDAINVTSARVEDALGPNPLLGGGLSVPAGAIVMPSLKVGVVVAAAYTQLGVPYLFGAESPGVAFDCSGLSKWAWKQAGVDLPHNAAEQFKSLPHVSRGQVVPGDLLFYRNPIGHVAIYIGQDKLIHAPAPGKFVEVQSVEWDKVVGIGRPGSPKTLQPTSGNVYYPIPDGQSELSLSDAEWGGYTQGNVPLGAFVVSSLVGRGHPVAVRSFTEMNAEATREGLDLAGLMYRVNGDNTLHSWGVAIDINVLTPSGDGKTNPKYPTYTKEQFYNTPEYVWLTQNAYRWGWAQPAMMQSGGNVAQPWHWEFWAFPNFKDGQAPSSGTTGYNPMASAYSPSVMSIDTSTNLFNAINYWTMNLGNDIESDVLSGERALMNDVPIITMVQDLVKAAGRSYCSAPNGDFIAWFPDYWDEYGTAGKLDVELVEIVDFEVQWSDESLITHQYVEGAMDMSSLGPTPGGTISDTSAATTRGVITVNTPNLLRTIANVSASRYPWLADPSVLLARFGARIDRKRIAILSTPEEEFWYAINEFTSSWAGQFSCSLRTTFLPEAFPGMILRIPAFGVKFYITGVRHNVDLRGDSGFSTSINIIAPSATDGSGFFLFPISGDYDPNHPGTPSSGGSSPTPSSGGSSPTHHGGSGPLKYR